MNREDLPNISEQNKYYASISGREMGFVTSHRINDGKE